jgi:hypothetical protein
MEPSPAASIGSARSACFAAIVAAAAAAAAGAKHAIERGWGAGAEGARARDVTLGGILLRVGSPRVSFS